MTQTPNYEVNIKKLPIVMQYVISRIYGVLRIFRESGSLETQRGEINSEEAFTDRNFVVEFDTWAKKFLDLTFCQHSNASCEYSCQNNWLIFVCAISELG